MAQILSYGVLGYFVGFGLVLNVLGIREMRRFK